MRHQATELKAARQVIKELNAKAKVFKESLSDSQGRLYPKLVSEEAELKEKLYHYMTENNLQSYEGIALATVLPSDVRKALMRNKRQSNVIEILEQADIASEKSAELAELIFP